METDPLRRGVLTSTQLPRGGVRQRWRFADTIRRGFSKCQEARWMYRTIELPTQIPIVSSILSFIAIHTEVTCSAALACTPSQVKVPKGSVSHTHDDGKENKTDERFGDIEPLCCLLDRRDHLTNSKFSHTSIPRLNTHDSPRQGT